MQWSLRAHGETLVLSRSRDGFGDRPVLPAIEAAWWVETLCAPPSPFDAMLRRDLEMILAAFGGACWASCAPIESLRARLSEALRSGDLFAARTSRPMRVQREAQIESLGPSDVPESEAKTTFVAIELVDQDGEPVVGRAVRILLPNNVVQEGTTNAEGKLRVKEIEPGTCEITFPGIFQPDFDWKPAQKGARSTQERGPVVSSYHSGASAEAAE